MENFKSFLSKLEISQIFIVSSPSDIIKSK